MYLVALLFQVYRFGLVILVGQGDLVIPEGPLSYQLFHLENKNKILLDWLKIFNIIPAPQSIHKARQKKTDKTNGDKNNAK